MRQVEQALCASIRKSGFFKSGDTTFDPVTHTVYLHGNAIARAYGVDGWQFNLCGWNTNTTRSRLNAIASEFGCNQVRNVKGVPHCAGKPVPLNEWFRPHA